MKNDDAILYYEHLDDNVGFDVSNKKIIKNK